MWGIFPIFFFCVNLYNRAFQQAGSSCGERKRAIDPFKQASELHQNRWRAHLVDIGDLYPLDENGKLAKDQSDRSDVFIAHQVSGFSQFPLDP